jgi:phosphate transport system substrate-binding protein
MTSKRFGLSLLLGAACSATLLCLGCGVSGTTSIPPGSSSSGSGGSGNLQGVGATFPAPLYQKWFGEYHKQHPGVQINYQGLGSSAGIEQFTKGLVNFGASDAAMTDEQIAKVPNGVILLPVTAGSIVLAYNLPGGPPELKLSREAYVDIFSGKIKSWDDPKIKACNKDATLPATKVAVVHRAEGSGTTFVFTKHLSEINEDFKKTFGSGTTVTWPKEGFIAAKGNQGVTTQIKQLAGAIGYIEYGYAAETKTPMATLENKAGKYVKPTIESGQAALARAQLPDDLRAWLPDPEGDDSYPIVTFTWLLVNKKYDDANVAHTLKDVLKYCLTDGQKESSSLGYLPLPETVNKKVLEAAQGISP